MSKARWKEVQPPLPPNTHTTGFRLQYTHGMLKWHQAYSATIFTGLAGVFIFRQSATVRARLYGLKSHTGKWLSATFIFCYACFKVPCVNLDILLLTITNIMIHSLTTGTIKSDFKTADAKPLLKKQSLDANALSNYHPISNLPFLSKILEKIILNHPLPL